MNLIWQNWIAEKIKKIIDNNKIIILTSTENQKNDEDKTNITMNLGECENILKREYNISNNNSLYILQVTLIV